MLQGFKSQGLLSVLEGRGVSGTDQHLCQAAGGCYCKIKQESEHSAHTWALVITRGLCSALTAQGAPECLWEEEGHCAKEVQVGHWEEFIFGRGSQSLAVAAQGAGAVPIPGDVQGRPGRGTQCSKLVTRWGFVTSWTCWSLSSFLISMIL